MSKTTFEVHNESTGEMKLADDESFTCVCTFSLNFEIIFLELSWEIVFAVISGNYLYFWLF